MVNIFWHMKPHKFASVCEVPVASTALKAGAENPSITSKYVYHM